MSDNTENLVLEHLRHIRGSVDRIEQRLDDLTTRVGHIETNLAHVQVQLAEHSIRFDRLEARIARIEKRLAVGGCSGLTNPAAEARDLTGGAVKLSLGRKRHVLLTVA